MSTAPRGRPGFAVVILAGGTGRRLGGVDKAALEIAGVRLLDGVLLATAGAGRTVVVGEPRPTVREVVWAREDPPGTGPLAGLLAGSERLQELEPSEPSEQAEEFDLTGVFATDLARLAEPDVQRLLRALTPASDGAVFVDATGHRQPLAAVYRTAVLRRTLAQLRPVQNRPMRALLDRLTLIQVPDQGAATDCDTPAQLAELRRRTSG